MGRTIFLGCCSSKGDRKTSAKIKAKWSFDEYLNKSLRKKPREFYGCLLNNYWKVWLFKSLPELKEKFRQNLISPSEEVLEMSVFSLASVIMMCSVEMEWVPRASLQELKFDQCCILIIYRATYNLLVINKKIFNKVEKTVNSFWALGYKEWVTMGLPSKKHRLSAVCQVEL